MPQVCRWLPVSTSSVSTSAVTPPTTAPAPVIERRHGPASTIPVITAIPTTIVVTRTTAGWPADHHGTRLAPEAAAGSGAPASAATLVTPRTRRRFRVSANTPSAYNATWTMTRTR